MRRRLVLLRDAVAARVSEITERAPEWPCRRGCDDCCRALATPLAMTESEWRALRGAIDALPPHARAEVDARLEALARGVDARVCPLLDRREGACLVYEERPLACRTYGFHVGRDGGRWCATIEARVEEGMADGVLLGNHDAIEATRARELGGTRSIVEWLRDA